MGGFQSRPIFWEFQKWKCARGTAKGVDSGQCNYFQMRAENLLICLGFPGSEICFGGAKKGIGGLSKHFRVFLTFSRDHLKPCGQLACHFFGALEADF